MTEADEKKLFERLTRLVIPTNYDVTIQPNLEDFTFKGKVLVDIQVQQATNKIVLYAAELEISQASISKLF